MTKDIDVPAKGGKSKWDRAVRISFIVVAIVATGLILMNNRNHPLTSWPDDLNAALVKAKGEKHNVLVFFRNNPPGELDRRLASETIGKNGEAIDKSKVIPVEVAVDLKSPQAGRYKLTELPTLLLIDPNGKELNRREGTGTISELGFREFLNLGKIEKK